MRIGLLIPLITTVFLFSCKKENTPEHKYLQGVLMDSIQGNPLSGVDVYFYKNEVPGILGFFYEPEELLEVTTTNADGHFSFEGTTTDDDKTCTYGASIRLADGTILAQGCLGKGVTSKNQLDSNGYLGKLYRYGARFSLNALVPITSETGVEHQVTDFNFSYTGEPTLAFYQDSVPGYQLIHISNIQSEEKVFYRIEPDEDVSYLQGGYRFLNNRMYIQEVPVGPTKTVDLNELYFEEAGFQGDFYFVY